VDSSGVSLIGPVNSADLVENTQLQAREWYQVVEHPELEESVTYPGPPFRHSETPPVIRRRPPLVGEHTVEILGGELGLTGEELTALAAARVI
jgi:crotonobetainyl-CoA:carnitine CoA-transferase CaiB-like acyl-CoA transferase